MRPAAWMKIMKTRRDAIFLLTKTDLGAPYSNDSRANNFHNGTRVELDPGT